MLTIRPATDEDAPVVASIIGQSFVKQVEALTIRRLEYSVHELRRVQSLPFELLFMQKVLAVGGSKTVA